MTTPKLSRDLRLLIIFFCLAQYYRPVPGHVLGIFYYAPVGQRNYRRFNLSIVRVCRNLRRFLYRGPLVQAI
jgi:hypothetical protein